MTVKAIRIHETGGPEVMRWEDVSVGDPGAGEVRLRHTAVGLNYIDIQQRSGGYPMNDLPVALGMEGAGVIDEIGPEVAGFAARRPRFLLHGARQLFRTTADRRQSPD